MLDRLRALLAGRAAERVRLALLMIALLYGAYWFVRDMSAHTPLRHWLLWRYLGYWLGAGAFSLACVSSGQRVLRLLGRPEEGLREELLQSFGLGVLIFGAGVFGLGLAGLLRPATFFALPLALILAGGRPALRLLRRTGRLLRQGLRPRRPVTALGRIALALAALFGILGVILVYASAFHPENASFDARWYHLGMAEQYAAQGAVRRFPEGWYIGAYPQLATYIYTWAFLLPRSLLFDKVALAAHLELSFLPWTLLGVSALVDRLIPRVRPRMAWAAFFLFPGLFLYDSSFACGADHVAAFWAPLIFIALLRALRAATPRALALVAAFVAGAATTKYTAASLVVFAVPAIAVRIGWDLASAIRKKQSLAPPLRALGAGVAVGLIATAPHWLKNLIWYGNPIYPMAARLFRNRPWSPDAARVYSQIDLSSWTPQGTTAQKLDETLHALYQFSFIPHDFPKFHGAVPVFGSLFTLSILALPFLRGTRRVWALAVAAHLGVFFWYWTQHEDRYLQAMLPWMAAVVAATFALAWRAHVVPKAGVALLIALQVAWGAGVPFLPAHAMLGKSPFIAAVELLASDHRSNTPKRLEMSINHVAIGQAVPADGRLLVHEYNQRLGIGRSLLTDASAFQGGIHYGKLGSPRDAYELLRSLGATHVAWMRQRARGSITLAGDLVFFDMIARHTGPARGAGGFNVAPLVDAPDEPALGDGALFLGCKGTYQQGLYRRAALNVWPGGKVQRSEYPPPEVPLRDNAGELVSRSRYIAYEPACGGTLPPEVTSAFFQAATRGKMQLWIRRPAGGAVPAPPSEPAAAPGPEIEGDPLP